MNVLPPISCRFEGKLCTLVINRPPVNALTPRMVRQMFDVVTELAARTDLQVLVITGEGGPGHGFCPGADIRFRGSPEAEAEAAEDGPTSAPLQQLSRMIRELPMVTVAAINGAVAGAGLGLALACDLRVAAQSARLATAFLARGLSGDMGVWFSLIRIVGPARAREIALLVDKLTAEEACHLGLLAQVWDDAEFSSRLDGLAARLLAVPHGALTALKFNLLDAERLPFGDYLDAEIQRHLALSGGAESVALFNEFIAQRAVRDQARGVSER